MAGDEQLLDVPGDRALSPSTASISAGIEQPGFFASLLATESSTTLASESTQRTAAVSPPLAVPSLYTTPAGIWAHTGWSESATEEDDESWARATRFMDQQNQNQ